MSVSFLCFPEIASHSATSRALALMFFLHSDAPYDLEGEPGDPDAHVGLHLHSHMLSALWAVMSLRSSRCPPAAVVFPVV